MYKVQSISTSRWIYISGDDSFDEPDEFTALVKEYQLLLDGKLITVSDDTQYSILNDPLKLIFQWDSLFGITVIVPPETDITAAQNAMQSLCETLNIK